MVRARNYVAAFSKSFYRRTDMSMLELTPDFSALRFTKYNQYESMILPLVKYLEAHGVQIEYGMDVKNRCV